MRHTCGHLLWLNALCACSSCGGPVLIEPWVLDTHARAVVIEMALEEGASLDCVPCANRRVKAMLREAQRLKDAGR